MNAQQQEIYMGLLMAGREDEAIAYRRNCDALPPTRNFALATGRVYTNRNGSDYLCKAIREPGCYIMERVKDGWTLEAHIITMYPDGTIEWDYSTGGRWTR